MKNNDIFKEIRNWCYRDDVPKEQIIKDFQEVIHKFIEVQEALLYGFETTEEDGAIASDVLEYLAAFEEYILEEK